MLQAGHLIHCQRRVIITDVLELVNYKSRTVQVRLLNRMGG